ncbi:MAG: 1-acyl-sn-glycerol-3-phosphate acyltransferase [Gemmatimonadetes bacterium]|nr:1-acyl-sn-glycerol-3-phosphate acyltransferase [Gemmatimonadota bacterium]
MSDLGANVRSTFRWAISFAHFIPATLLLVALRPLLGPRLIEPLLRLYSRNVVRLAGMRLEVERSPRIDAGAKYLFLSNHVNVFDPFVVYASLGQRARGLELESHFDVPVYGWLMRAFGNVPVPDRPSREGLARLDREARDRLDRGYSLVIFPEGTRTRDGSLSPFRSGVFRLATRWGAAIVPVSMTGAFEFQQVSGFRLRPGVVRVRLHDPIEVDGRTPDQLSALAFEVIRSEMDSSGPRPRPPR